MQFLLQYSYTGVIEEDKYCSSQSLHRTVGSSCASVCGEDDGGTEG